MTNTNFFQKLLNDKFNSFVSPYTYRHAYCYRLNGALEVLVKLHPDPINRIYIFCLDNRIKVAFFKKTITGKYQLHSKIKIIYLSRSFEKYLQPLDYFNIFENIHVPFSLYCPSDAYEFLTKDL